MWMESTMAAANERRGVGRPKSEEPDKQRRGTTLFSQEEWEQIEAATGQLGVAFSTWSRQLLLDEATRITGGSTDTRLRLVVPREIGDKLTTRAKRVNYANLALLGEDVMTYLANISERDFIRFTLTELMDGILDEAMQAADAEEESEGRPQLRKSA